MCYAKPRPRCSDHVQQKITSRTQIWNKRKDDLGPEHPKTLAAKTLLQSAIQELDTTDGGIKQLKKQLEIEPNNPILQKRLQKGSTVNQLRTEAGKELDKQRPQALGTLFSEAIPYYDYAETKSIIDATVEYNIKFASRTGINNTTPVSEEEYHNYLNNLEQGIIQNKGQLDERAQKTLKLLREQTPPSETTMNAYRNIDKALLTGKNQLEQEIIRTATLQETHPRTLASFYEGYRKQYNDNYLNLPPEQRPDPPQHWVEGELSGYRTTRNTSLAPSDPASLYAIHRLRTDPTAIPEQYKTKKRNIVAVHLIMSDNPKSKQAQQGNTAILGVSMTETTPDGQTVSRKNTWIQPPKNLTQQQRDKIVKEQGIDPTKLSKKPRWADVKDIVEKELQGKTLLVTGEASTVNTLRNHMSESWKPTAVIDVNDIASKHFSQNDPSLKTSTDTLNLSEYADNIKRNTESELLVEAYRTQRQKTATTWNKKPERKNAPILTKLPNAGRWAKPEPKQQPEQPV